MNPRPRRGLAARATRRTTSHAAGPGRGGRGWMARVAVLGVLAIIMTTAVRPAAAAAGSLVTRRAAVSQFMCGSVEHPELGNCGSGLGANSALVLHPSTGDMFTAGTLQDGFFPGFTSAGQGDYYIARHSAATGARLWVAQGGTSSGESVTGVALDPTTGDAVVAGTTDGAFSGFVNAGQGDYYIARHNAATGARLWVAQGGTNSGESVTGVALDPTTGDAVVAGTTSGAFTGFTSAGGNDYYIARHSAATGARLWVAQGGTSGDYAGVAGVALDPTTGDAIVVGWTSGAFPGFVITVTSYISMDYYIARHSAATGARLWVVQGGTGSFLGMIGVALDPTTGDAVVAGTTQGVFAGIDPYTLSLSTWYIAAHNGTSGRRLWVAQEGPKTRGARVTPTALAVDAATGDVVVAFITPGQFAGHEELVGNTYGFAQVPNPVHGRRAAPLAPGQGSGGGSCPGDSTDDFTISNNGVTYLSISGTSSTVKMNGPLTLDGSLQFKPPQAGGRSNNNLVCSESTRGTTRIVFNDTTGDKVEYCLRTPAGIYEWVFSQVSTT